MKPTQEEINAAGEIEFAKAKEAGFVDNIGESAAFKVAWMASADWAISQMQPEWVPCKHKDKLPEGKYILLLEKDGFQSESIFRVTEKESEREIPYYYVTHLIRLPKPKTK